MTAVRAVLRTSQELAAALAATGCESGEPGDGLVFVAAEVGSEWPDVLAELTTAFELTRRSAQAGGPIVYVVHNDDLLGRRGPGPAMVATGLLSGARTLAFETAKVGVPANVLAVEADSPIEVIARWTVRLLEPDGPSGELVRLGALHVGKALP
ncbi:MAG: hypothetical protein R6X29_02260 [Acidimicrobiia bacterium]